MSESLEISDDASSKKRKRSNDLFKKKSKRSKPNRDEDSFAEIDGTNKLDLSFARMDPNLLADHIAKKQKRFHADSTSLELEESRIPAGAIVDTTEWTDTRTLERLPEFLRQFSDNDNLKQSPKQPGAPHTIVVAGAGLRAADLTRALRELQTKDAKVAKLFAKHIKLSESIEMLQKTRISIGVGTPARLTALLDDGSLKADKIKRIVVDASYVDQKRRGILDMRETFVPLLTLLNRNEFKARLLGAEDGIKLLLY